MKLRRAKLKDCEQLYIWTNDETVRLNSFSTEKIQYETHEKWFLGKLNSEDSIIYIAEDNGTDVGQIRIDFAENKHIGFINYSVSKLSRGKGFGTEMLEQIKAEFKEMLLIGKVKIENESSIRCFVKANYSKKVVDDHYEFEFFISVNHLDTH